MALYSISYNLPLKSGSSSQAQFAAVINRDNIIENKHLVTIVYFSVIGQDNLSTPNDTCANSAVLCANNPHPL